MNTVIAGADGSREGWVVVLEDVDRGRLTWGVVPELEVLDQAPIPPNIVAVDVPVGLPGRGPRACDLEARRLLGPRRGTSVFPTPIRPVLDAGTLPAANCLTSEIDGKRLTLQTWAIMPKLREVDLLVRAELHWRQRVREVHPEICFYFMAGGRPMEHGKKTPEGRFERAELLRHEFGPVVDTALGDMHRLLCAPDDLLDAFAGLWTARRILRGAAITIPEDPPTDELGLPMEMFA